MQTLIKEQADLLIALFGKSIKRSKALEVLSHCYGYPNWDTACKMNHLSTANNHERHNFSLLNDFLIELDGINHDFIPCIVSIITMRLPLDNTDYLGDKAFANDVDHNLFSHRNRSAIVSCYVVSGDCVDSISLQVAKHAYADLHLNAVLMEFDSVIFGSYAKVRRWAAEKLSSKDFGKQGPLSFLAFLNPIFLISRLPADYNALLIAKSDYKSTLIYKLRDNLITGPKMLSSTLTRDAIFLDTVYTEGKSCLIDRFWDQREIHAVLNQPSSFPVLERTKPPAFRSLDTMLGNFPDIKDWLKNWIERGKGTGIICGSVRSGRTTMLSHLLNHSLMQHRHPVLREVAHEVSVGENLRVSHSCYQDNQPINWLEHDIAFFDDAMRKDISEEIVLDAVDHSIQSIVVYGLNPMQVLNNLRAVTERTALLPSIDFVLNLSEKHGAFSPVLLVFTSEAAKLALAAYAACSDDYLAHQAKVVSEVNWIKS